MTAGAATGTAPRLDPHDPLGIESLLSDEERAGRDEGHALAGIRAFA